MIPTHITVSLMLPGYSMDERGRASDKDTIQCDASDGFAYLENEGRAIYSVEQKKLINAEDALTDDAGKLAETLLVFESMTEIGNFAEPLNGPWLWKYMCDGTEPVDESNMAAILDDVRPMLEEARKPSDTITERLKSDAVIAETCRLWRFSFPANWSLSVSTDWETGTTDIDSVDYAGLARIS